MATAGLPALYSGHVTHVRSSPLTHRFRYPVCYWLVDVDQLPQPGGWLRFLTRVDRADHVDIRALLGERGRSAARILMLSTARSFGYVFNPISVFWCYDAGGTCTTVVAEVHNTYGGQHSYVFETDLTGSAKIEKALYVSPFYPVDGSYRFTVSEPAESVSVSVTLEREGADTLVAVLRGQRRPATMINVLRSALRRSGARTSALIRWQGIRLWRRGLPVYPR